MRTSHSAESSEFAKWRPRGETKILTLAVRSREERGAPSPLRGALLNCDVHRDRACQAACLSVELQENGSCEDLGHWRRRGSLIVPISAVLGGDLVDARQKREICNLGFAFCQRDYPGKVTTSCEKHHCTRHRPRRIHFRRERECISRGQFRD